MSDAPYTPKGIEFIDLHSGRQMLLVSEEEEQVSWRGWIMWRHPDGQWVSLRKATADDRLRIALNPPPPQHDRRFQ